MKPRKTLNQLMAWNEYHLYIYSNQNSALDCIEDMFASGEVSSCERPRVISYRSSNGIMCHAVVLTDTSMELIQ